MQRVLRICFASFLLTSFISKLDQNEKNENVSHRVKTEEIIV